MNTEEETSMQAETVEIKKESVGGNENFVVLDMAGDSEDSDKDDKTVKVDTRDKSQRNSGSDNGGKASNADSSKAGASNSRLRKKPKAPVVDVNSLRKRKWQLKVYPLHAEDLQLNYMSILCKLASESLLYIPSEGRHGKAELYVATQKETAAIIGKLLRMGFHHNLLSIEVVRKDTGGKEDGDDSKKECKAFLMFDKFLSKKIFDAKGEKGTLIEKTVTLNKLPRAATKDFIGAIFPFATEIEIIESDNPDERKATVKCKTPVTSLLVYKSFKRLEINDVHVKLSVDELVKAITLPPMFFIPTPNKKDTGPPDSIESLNQSSLPRRPIMSSLNRRVQQIKKRAMMTRKKPTRGQLMRGQRMNQGMDDGGDGPRGQGGRHSLSRRGEGRFGTDPKNHGPGSRDYPGGPGRRRMNERQNDRRNRDRDSRDRGSRRNDREESQVTKEMLQLQNQLNQAIKNQIAMLSTAQTSGGHNFSLPGSSHRTSLLGHAPRHFGATPEIGLGSSRAIDPHSSEFGGSSWSGDRSSRIDNRAGDRTDDRVERLGRAGGDRIDRPNRPDRVVDRSKRVDLNRQMDSRPDRLDRGSRDRAERSDRNSSGADLSRQAQRSQRNVSAFSSVGTSGESGRTKDRSSINSASEAARGGSRGQRGPEYPGTSRVSQRNDGTYSSASHSQSVPNRYSDFSAPVEGDGNYYRRY
uniref:Uncharacterized protein n=1 Tax=Biomphalaria glabrata TaxID=6526 RepID=A0A2C9M6A5_BIOGL